jgi:hypothetical protein
VVSNIQVSEWRVQRLTNVSARTVLSAYKAIDTALCDSLGILLELHNLWQDEALPKSWLDNQLGRERCAYSRMLFIDVNQQAFQIKLPMLLDDFVSHIDVCCKDVREALLEFWIVSVGFRLSAAVERLNDEPRTLDTEILEDDAQDDLAVVNRIDSKNRDSIDNSDGDDDLAMSGEFCKFQMSLKRRMHLEGVEDGGLLNRTSKKATAAPGGLNGTANGEKCRGRNSAERMVSSAVVLLSRQLRGMCEASLLSLAELFEKLPRALTAEYSG